MTAIDMLERKKQACDFCRAQSGGLERLEV
jgi:hypothetical protein